VDLRGQHQSARIHQDVALSPSEALRSVVAALGAAHSSGLHDLAVDHRGAGVPVASLSLTHLFAQPVVRPSEPSVEPPLRKW
jgi:hypothetical protein